MQEMMNFSLFDLIDANFEQAQDSENNDNSEELKKDNSFNNTEEINVEDDVNIEYGGITYLGKAHTIYNNGETINVIFDGKHSAFHISKVKKIN